MKILFPTNIEGIQVRTMQVGLILFTTYILLLSGCASVKYSDQKVCDAHNWGDVESLISKYLSADLQTAFNMQGQSIYYNPSVAASEALGYAFDKTANVNYPNDVLKSLQLIANSNCNDEMTAWN